MLQHVFMLANMIQKERRMMQGRQKITARAKSLLGEEMEDAVEREKSKGRKEIKYSV